MLCPKNIPSMANKYPEYILFIAKNDSYSTARQLRSPVRQKRLGNKVIPLSRRKMCVNIIPVCRYFTMATQQCFHRHSSCITLVCFANALQRYLSGELKEKHSERETFDPHQTHAMCCLRVVHSKTKRASGCHAKAVTYGGGGGVALG